MKIKNYYIKLEDSIGDFEKASLSIFEHEKVLRNLKEFDNIIVSWENIEHSWLLLSCVHGFLLDLQNRCKKNNVNFIEKGKENGCN